MRLHRLAAILLAAVCYALPGGPADHKPEHSYVIASPNTRSSLNDGDAQSSLTTIFQQKVDAFEKHRQRLSSNLWSRRWHDATAPTCSTKMPSAGGR